MVKSNMMSLGDIPFSAEHVTSYQHLSLEVFATIVSLLFQVPGLQFDKPLDHFEAFSGKMSVTKGEWNETHTTLKRKLKRSPIQKHILFLNHSIPMQALTNKCFAN